jgi:hypothetical protein
VKPGIAGVTSATKTDNLGTFDYAHLRVPLPKDLTGSGIFTLNRTSAFPESYFLMVRAKDLYLVPANSLTNATNSDAAATDTSAQRECSRPPFPGHLSPRRRQSADTRNRFPRRVETRWLAAYGLRQRRVSKICDQHRQQLFAALTSVVRSSLTLRRVRHASLDRGSLGPRAY